MRSDLTQERLKELFSYDPATGQFTRLCNRANQKAGPVAGCLTPDGYRVLGIDYQIHLMQRLAWLYVHGKFPDGFADHKDGNRQHNAIDNLRDVPQWLNNQNSHAARGDNKTTGILGVTRDPRPLAKPFKAQIMVRGSHRKIGYFATAEEASAAYLAAKRQFHEGNTL